MDDFILLQCPECKAEKQIRVEDLYAEMLLWKCGCKEPPPVCVFSPPPGGAVVQ